MARFIGYRPIHTASATMTTTAAMKISAWTFDMRHMMRRLYVDAPRRICFTRAGGRQRSGKQPRPSKTTALDFWVPWDMSQIAGAARPCHLSIFAFFVFRLSYAEFRFIGSRKMRRVPLVQATMEAWARLNEPQRQKFFEAFVAAAVRLDQLALRAWLRRRLKNPPLAPPFDPARLLGDADIALVLRAAGEADPAEPDRDGADGGSDNRHGY